MYNKLFTKILDSSIWLETDSTRIVWLTLIAAMDETGFVQFASVANLAHRARVEESHAVEAVKRLESPDANSSDPENEGRRIERVPGGWIILNAEKYRDLVTRAVAQEKTRQRVARFREKHKVTLSNGDVTPPLRSVTPSEAVSDAEAETKAVGGRAGKAALPDAEFLSSLRTSDAYKGIDFDREVEKCRVWSGINRKEFTRRRLIAWLNRIERPISADSSPASGSQRPDPYKEPSFDWRAVASRVYPDAMNWINPHDFTKLAWSVIDLDQRKKILKSA